MRWTTSSLQELVGELRGRRGDTTTVEVKAAAGGYPDLADTLCATYGIKNTAEPK